MTGKGGDKEGETEREGGKTGRGERQGRGTDRVGEKGRQGRQTGRGNREGGGTDREGGQTGRGDIHRGRHSLLLVGGGLVRRSLVGGHLCWRCPSTKGHRRCHLAWASSYVGGVSSSRWVLVPHHVCGWCSVVGAGSSFVGPVVVDVHCHSVAWGLVRH